MIHVRQFHDLGKVVLEFSGALDLRSAEELAAVALQQPAALHLVIDISRASSIDDSALGRLVDSLPRFRPHTVRGASRHHARVLGYLGEKIEPRGEAESAG